MQVLGQARETTALLQPAGLANFYLYINNLSMAEGVGFEPTTRL